MHALLGRALSAVRAHGSTLVHEVTVLLPRNSQILPQSSTLLSPMSDNGRKELGRLRKEWDHEGLDGGY